MQMPVFTSLCYRTLYVNRRWTLPPRIIVSDVPNGHKLHSFRL